MFNNVNCEACSNYYENDCFSVPYVDIDFCTCLSATCPKQAINNKYLFTKMYCVSNSLFCLLIVNILPLKTAKWLVLYPALERWKQPEPHLGSSPPLAISEPNTSKVQTPVWPCLKGIPKYLKEAYSGSPFYKKIFLVIFKSQTIQNLIENRWRESFFIVKIFTSTLWWMQLAGLNAGTGGMFSAPSSDPLIMALIGGGNASPEKEGIPLARQLDLFSKSLFLFFSPLITGKHTPSDSQRKCIFKHHLCGQYAKPSLLLKTGLQSSITSSIFDISNWATSFKPTWKCFNKVTDFFFLAI